MSKHRVMILRTEMTGYAELELEASSPLAARKAAEAQAKSGKVDFKKLDDNARYEVKSL